MTIKIQGQLSANGAFPLADGTEIKGSVLIGDTLAALQGYLLVQRLTVKQIGVDASTGIPPEGKAPT